MGRKPEIIGCAQGEVAEEFEVADGVGAQLEIAGGHTVHGFATEGA